MTLEEIRKEIDAIDPRIRALLMERLDCAYQVAEAKNISGDLRVYRPDPRRRFPNHRRRGIWLSSARSCRPAACTSTVFSMTGTKVSLTR